MTEYVTPLPRLFAAALEAGINRVLDLDEKSGDRLGRLEGKLLQLDLTGIEITLFIRVQDRGVRVDLDAESEPDTTVRGSPAALISMAAGDEDGGWSLPDSSVEIFGDANLARDLERLFSRLDPDFEGFISGFTGDVVANQVAAGLRQGVEVAQEALRSGSEMLGGWITGEGELGVKPDEMRRFVSEVDALRKAAEKLQARMDGLTESES